ncbi:MAG: hypothetical protein GTN97_00355 [Nitrosopumilaceae archaeon]|nr:hypothetical protein [Nitrosopumilaceae archaeon]NIP09242.1 hypothetical protein [Nitrosopumilaceae archaeon]NIS94390.1 hypothetical protein [Nitrosopumilaceae archaeon]
MAIYDGHFKAKYQKGIKGKIKEEEIRNSLAEAHLRWDFRKKWNYRIGKPSYSIEKYDKINRVTIPLEEQGLVLITTETNLNVQDLIPKINKICRMFF